MKVIEKAVKTVYRVVCCKCGSKLVRRFKDRSFIYEETEG